MSSKSPKILALLLAIPGASADQEVREQSLNGNPVRVPVSALRYTTVELPEPILAFNAARMSNDPRPPNVFQVVLRDGDSAFSVRAVTKGAQDNANVLVGDRYYVFDFYEDSETPTLLVRMLKPPIAEAVQLPAGKTKVQRLLTLMDTARAYQNLKRLHPETVKNVEYIQADRIMDFGDTAITIKELWDFRVEDALVMRCEILNRTDAQLHYDPSGFALKVRNNTFPQALCDGSGSVAPNDTTSFFLTFSGAPDGRRAGLSFREDFVLLFTRGPGQAQLSPRKTFRLQTMKAH